MSKTECAPIYEAHQSITLYGFMCVYLFLCLLSCTCEYTAVQFLRNCLHSESLVLIF